MSMRRNISVVVLFILSAFVWAAAQSGVGGGGQSNVSGGGGGGGTPTPSVGLNSNYWYLVKSPQTCGTATNCTVIFGDTQYSNDATSTSTTTVTCPSNDCNFVAGDVGKTAWATTNTGVSTFGIALNNTIVCPVTTIQTVNSAQSVTLANTCTASGSANVVFVWGHRDGATLHALDGSGMPCVDIEPFSRAVIMVDQAEFIVPGTCTQQLAFTGKNWGRAGGGSSAMVMTPDFNFATCTGNGGTHTGNNVCFGSGLGQANDLFIWGNGLSAAGNANCANASGKTILALNPGGGSMVGTNVAGVCYGETGEGVEVNSIDEYWTGGGAQFAMTQPCLVSSGAAATTILDCRNDGFNFSYGLTIISGGNDVDIGSYPMVGTVVLTGGTLSSRGTHFVGATGNNTCDLQIQGSWFSYGDFVGVDTSLSQTNPANTGLCFSAGGIVQSANTVYKSTGSGGAISWGGGTFTSLGGNTVSGIVLQTSVPSGIVGPDVLQGSCTGVVTSATTVGLFGLGNNTTTTCTSTTVTLGPVMGKAGTVYNLACAATAGNQAADACTVLKNGVAQSMTCSLNGVASCTDGAIAHQFAYAKGDIITVETIGGVTTTLASVKASVLAW